jgi:hypothetical protein
MASGCASKTAPGPGPQRTGWWTATASTAVVIDSERGAASVWFYRVRDGKQFYLTPVAIDEVLRTSAEEKALLLSTDPGDAPAASALSRRISLLNQPGWRVQGLKTFEELEKCLENYAGWLKEHAGLCLTGDFSRWPAFYEYKVERARAECLRRGEDKLVRALLKDAEGSWQVIKRPLFADEREHIEELKMKLRPERFFVPAGEEIGRDEHRRKKGRSHPRIAPPGSGCFGLTCPGVSGEFPFRERSPVDL